MRPWLVVALVGCGRLEFADQPDASVVTTIDAAVSIPCPASFVGIAGNATIGTTDFCVMQTEARAWIDTNANAAIDPGELDDDGCGVVACDEDWGTGTHRPVSPLPSSAPPWVSVNQRTAAGACQSLGPGFDMIANREWMTIARSAELDGRNWSSGTPGTGRMVEGMSEGDDAPGAILDPNDPYSGTNNNATQLPDVGWEQRRTLHVGSVVLWDLPGSVQEWIDWQLGAPLDGPPPCVGTELPALTCAGYAVEDFQTSTGTYDRTHGVGYVLAGMGESGRRGGQVSDRVQGLAGIYSLNMNRDQVDTFPATGFRCVYRP